MKVLLVNVPWMKYYEGEGDEEVKVPECGYNFQYVDGYYYGYTGEESLPIIEEVMGEQDEVSSVTIVWVAQNREGQNKVVGWYKEATLYKEVKRELTLDEARTLFVYNIKAPASKALLLPVEHRQLDILEEKEIKWLTSDEPLSRDLLMYMHNYQGDQMNYIFKTKDIEGCSILNFAEYEMYFQKADEFLAKNLYDRAVRCFNKAIHIEPDLTMAYEAKGSIFLSLRMYKEALAVYETIMKLEPENKEALYCIALIKGLLKEYKESLVAYDTYLHTVKEDYNAVAERAVIQHCLGKTKEARSGIEEALKADCTNLFYQNVKVLIEAE